MSKAKLDNKEQALLTAFEAGKTHFVLKPDRAEQLMQSVDFFIFTQGSINHWTTTG